MLSPFKFTDCCCIQLKKFEFLKVRNCGLFQHQRLEVASAVIEGPSTTPFAANARLEVLDAVDCLAHVSFLLNSNTCDPLQPSAWSSTFAPAGPLFSILVNTFSIL